jgi:hypothetical protein
MGVGCLRPGALQDGDHPRAGELVRPVESGRSSRALRARIGPGIEHRLDHSRILIYVQAFPEARDKFPVSIGGGAFPAWGDGGRELYYVSKDRQLMSVALNFGASGPEASRPRELFPVPPMIAGAPFDVAPGGRRFLTSAAQSTSQPLNVVVNWAALMKQPPASR